MSTTHAVGIDLGTTYSCIACLNEQGEPVSISNAEGEISTPSVVMYDKGEEIVGNEALRNAIMYPQLVVQNAKRYMGDPQKKWTIEGKEYNPTDVSAAILRKLLRDAQQQIGPIEQAVITVPAQFSERQRLATVEAAQHAGLSRVNIINEPVAAALCYVLGTEGLWFTELADEQRILVYDLGGGTFDLSLVTYQKDQVLVIASTGDLHLGGIDWNQCLLNAVAEQFTREFGEDPRRDPESLQHLAIEVESCKRSLTVRNKAALIVQHAGKRKTYQIERDQFNQLTQHLVRRTEEITRKLIEQYRRGSAHLDLTVLSTGGSSRMPMVHDMLTRLRGTTINRTLSPDQSIAHGATYYAGMLLTNSEFVHSITDAEAVARLSKMKQQSVNARALGILVRDMESNRRVPHYLLPPNTPLPASITKNFGTVVPNQKRVTLLIIESGAGTENEYAVLGNCTIDELPPDLPAESRIAVTIEYDASARVTVSARDVTSGKVARTEIDRSESIVLRDAVAPAEETVTLAPADNALGIPVAIPDSISEIPVPAALQGAPSKPVTPPRSATPSAAAKPKTPPPVPPAAGRPPVKPVVPTRIVAPAPGGAKPAPASPAASTKSAPAASKKPPVKPAAQGGIKPVPSPVPLPRKPEADEIMELPRKKPATPSAKRPEKPPIRKSSEPDPGEQEFWNFADQ